jgi:ferredoxin
MTVKVDKELCISCGVCVQTCPEVFDFGDDGKAEVISKDGCNGCDCEDVADSCPTDAITVEE